LFIYLLLFGVGEWDALARVGAKGVLLHAHAHPPLLRHARRLGRLWFRAALLLLERVAGSMTDDDVDVPSGLFETEETYVVGWSWKLCEALPKGGHGLGAH
jgi:hypothetical protein